MKSIVLLLVLIATSLPAFSNDAERLYQMGLAAMNQGQPEAAEKAFREALRIQPNHAQARYQLGQLPARAEALKAQRRAAELAEIRLPAIDFAGVTLNEALAALGQMIETESAKSRGEDKALTPNFMVQDPGGSLGDKEVNLRLKNVPAKVALDYLLQQVGATARYDEHATVIRPAK
ncbi:tetratricopeptide repeat protein [Haloferula sp. A504]|uniref:tetratricopeptide repeat protein n=1 Tax=Haloferula sp. A504 TaxID=3373601 RepID=UPI0031CAF0AE|nr:tetratricopeptide repeat protein [Verrucomicrobiaceae bacterium E54]